MDYSSLPTDPDHPAGTSPWQSSPQPNSRPSFTATEFGRTVSQQASYLNPSQRRSEEDTSDQETLVDESYRPQLGENGASHQNGTSPETSQSLQHSDDNAQQQNRQPQSQQQQRVTGPNRYHGTTRAAQRQTLPQYKLQAKIVGLERTGRKDPVLRFMVHVRYGKVFLKYQI